jgi:hypothetical protein
MTADEIPQELLDIVDSAAGKVHSRSGPVAACLAAVLTRHAEMLGVVTEAAPVFTETIGRRPE